MSAVIVLLMRNHAFAAAVSDTLPVAGGGSDAASGNAEGTVALPAGPPADDATVTAVVGTLRHVAACINTGQGAGGLSFMSWRLLAEVSPAEANVFAAATPTPLPEEHLATLVVIDHVTEIDGDFGGGEGDRIGALVATIFPPWTLDVQVDCHFFVRQAGGWPIDEVVDNVEVQYRRAAATPVA